jgi:hypothetical protein
MKSTDRQKLLAECRMLLREMAKSNNVNSAQIVESSPTEESDGRMLLREMAKLESSPIEASDDDSNS